MHPWLGRVYTQTAMLSHMGYQFSYVWSKFSNSLLKMPLFRIIIGFFLVSCFLFIIYEKLINFSESRMSLIRETFEIERKHSNTQFIVYQPLEVANKNTCFMIAIERKNAKETRCVAVWNHRINDGYGDTVEF